MLCKCCPQSKLSIGMKAFEWRSINKGGFEGSRRVLGSKQGIGPMNPNKYLSGMDWIDVRSLFVPTAGESVFERLDDWVARRVHWTLTVLPSRQDLNLQLMRARFWTGSRRALGGGEGTGEHLRRSEGRPARETILLFWLRVQRAYLLIQSILIVLLMNETGNSFGSNPASLKGKLQTLEQQIKNISNELNNHKKEVQILRSEKDTLESVLTMKTADVKKSLSNELVRIEEEMKRHFNFQKAENSRIQQQITSLKGEKTALQQQLLGLQRRITELEMQVGSEGH